MHYPLCFKWVNMARLTACPEPEGDCVSSTLGPKDIRRVEDLAPFTNYTGEPAGQPADVA
jgi:hypothetical protein